MPPSWALPAAATTTILTVVDPAQVPTDPTSPRVALNTLVVTVLLLVNAIALAFLLEYLDDTLKSSDDVEAMTGLPTIGAIRPMRLGRGRSPMYGLATLLYPRAAAAEAYRTLRTNVDFANVDNPIRSILVTSALPNEGKTTTAANLAVAIAQTGSNTILLDADLRRPGVHQMFDLPNHEGLTSVLRPDGATVEGVAQTTEQANLRVITTGPLPPNPVEMRASRAHGTPPRDAQGAGRRRRDRQPTAPGRVRLGNPVHAGRRHDHGRVGRPHSAQRRPRRHQGPGGTTRARTLGVVLNRLSHRGRHDDDAYQHDYHASEYGPKDGAPAGAAEEHATLGSATRR